MQSSNHISNSPLFLYVETMYHVSLLRVVYYLFVECLAGAAANASSLCQSQAHCCNQVECRMLLLLQRERCLQLLLSVQNLFLVSNCSNNERVVVTELYSMNESVHYLLFVCCIINHHFYSS